MLTEEEVDRCLSSVELHELRIETYLFPVCADPLQDLPSSLIELLCFRKMVGLVV